MTERSPLREHTQEPPIRDVRALLTPRSIVAIGATERRAAVIDELARGEAPVHLVHPQHRSVAGRPCAPSVSELPIVPELALLLVGHGGAVAAFEEAVEAGVRAFVVPGLGAEAGAAAEPAIERIVRVADDHDVAILGPNTMGRAQPGGGSPWVGTVPETFLAGHVSVVAQSGSIADAMLTCGPRIGFRHVVSTGSERIRDVADYLGFLVNDDATWAVGLFLETVRRPRALAETLRACAEAGKPVVCLKVGRSAAAAEAALAHTGAMVGSAASFSAFLSHHGAIEVDDLVTLFETLEILGRRRWPTGPRVGAISESGGECALLADAAERLPLEFPPLPDELADALVDEFPNFGTVRNPVDAWQVADATVVFPRSLELMAAADGFDILLAQIDLTQYRGEVENRWSLAVVQGLVAACTGREVFPVVTTVHVTDPPPEIARFAREHDLALLRGTTTALKALAAVSAWRPLLPTEPDLSSAELATAADDLLSPGVLSEHRSSRFLEHYGVPVAERELAADADEAVAAARRLGYPVVVKMDGPAHKGAVGGVVLGVGDDDAVRAATERLGGQVLVARQVPAGPEVICGFTRDPDYGPMLAVGIGGRLAGSLSLAATALSPVNQDVARWIVRSAPGLAALCSPAASDDLVRTVLALSRIAVAHPNVRAVDVNPLILHDDGAIAVDALIIVEESP